MHALEETGAGHAVVATPTISVEHHGARRYQSGEASRLVRRAAYARGAMDMKLLRFGDMAALVLIPAHLFRYTTKMDLVNLVHGRGPTHLAWPVMYP